MSNFFKIRSDGHVDKQQNKAAILINLQECEQGFK